MTYLLDVNVLIALSDLTHPHHSSAGQWFEASGQSDWATCPLTENGLIRIISSKRYEAPMPSAAMAAEFLINLRKVGHHSFWPDDVSLTDAAIFHIHSLSSGHSTDIYLLGLAASKGGKLATFDRRLSTQAVIGGADALYVIDT